MLTPATPPIVWGPVFELGIEDIDLQHKYFANLILRLARDFDLHVDATERLGRMEEMYAYARFHFISEENLMRRAAYPALAEHKDLHRALIDDLSNRQSRLLINENEADAKEMVGLLVQWFLGHTTHEDRLFAEYLKNRPES